MQQFGGHQATPDPRIMTCQECRDGRCFSCCDLDRVLQSDEMPCQCDLPGHSGEPVQQQVKDPETGTVWAPGLHVAEGGEVVFDKDREPMREAFKRLLGWPE